MKKYLFLSLLLAALFSCASSGKAAAPVEESFILPELEPQRIPDDAPPPIIKDEEKLYVYGVIMEVEMDMGEQTGFYAKVNQQEQSYIKKGSVGEVFEDESYTKKIGVFMVDEDPLAGYLHGSLTELFYTAKMGYPVRIEIKVD